MAGRFTHVVAPFPIPESWRRFRSFDFGYSRPFSVGWWALDPHGTLVRYREWYGCTGVPNAGLRLTPKAIARGIAEAERAHERGLLVTGYADPSIWDGSRGESIAQRCEDVDTQGEDHIYDEWRYLFMAHPLPEAPKPAPRRRYSPLD